MVIKLKKLNRKGFTLIELLAVIAVTSLVLGLSSYGIISAYNRSKEKTIVLNESSILEAARISSTEASKYEWKTLGDGQYFCTTIQRLKNAGLLKKEATSKEHDDASIITVERNASTFNVNSINFLTDEDTELIDLCNIKFFTINYNYNAGGENGKVPNDQKSEACSNTDCLPVKISAYIPKRSGYVFREWNTKSDGTGDSYIPSQSYQIPVFGESTLTLYAQWVRDEYQIIFNGNSDSYTGTTATVTCIRGQNCTLTKNGFEKTGYTFSGWNTKSDGTGIKYYDEQPVKDITSSNKITLYAMWKSAHKVIIKFNAGNGASITASTSDSNHNYSWKKNTSGIISRSKDGGAYSNSFFSIKYGNSKHLPSYDDDNYMKITNSGYNVSSNVWKCTSGACSGKTYDLVRTYNSSDFCDASSSDCTITLTVNWEQILSPTITASDGIQSDRWHNQDYSLIISSENTGEVSYQYKVESGSYNTYNGSISINEETGGTTYIARTKMGTSYSGETSYIAKLDKTPPTVPIIDNPTNGEWTNQNFALTLHSTDNLSGIAYYQYKYADTNWKTYSNSASTDFTTTDFSLERNELVYVRACDNAGNCSDSSSTYIRIDKTIPTVDFKLLNSEGQEQDAKYYSLNGTVSDWFSFTPVLKFDGNDNLSGMNSAASFYYNSAGKGILDKTVINNGETLYWNNGIILRTIDSDGYRYVYLNTCDNAGNCINKEVYFKVDRISPNIDFTMLDDSNDTEVSDIYYHLDSNGTSTWFNFTPKFRFIASDILSGVKYSAEFSWNDVGLSNLSTNIIGSSSIDGVKYDDFTYNFDRTISSSGYRYVQIRICDKVNNCDTKDAYFKFDDVEPTVSYSLEGGTYNSNQNLTITAQDTGGSGYSYMKVDVYRDGTLNSSKSNSRVTNGSYSLSLEAGDWNVSTTVYDSAGNIKSISKDYIISQPAPSNQNYYVILNPNGGTGASGRKDYTYRLYFSSLNVTKRGCSLTGWKNTRLNKVLHQYVDSGSNGDTLVAQWSCTTGPTYGSNHKACFAAEAFRIPIAGASNCNEACSNVKQNAISLGGTGNYCWCAYCDSSSGLSNQNGKCCLDSCYCNGTPGTKCGGLKYNSSGKLCIGVGGYSNCCY